MGKTKKVQDGLGGGAEAAELFTVEQLTEISQNRDPVANDLAGDVAALIPEMRKGGIVTKNRITAFLANVCQETDHLNTLEEYGRHSYWLGGHKAVRTASFKACPEGMNCFRTLPKIGLYVHYDGFRYPRIVE